jgi:hypothetical protein
MYFGKRSLPASIPISLRANSSFWPKRRASCSRISPCSDSLPTLNRSRKVTFRSVACARERRFSEVLLRLNRTSRKARTPNRLSLLRSLSNCRKLGSLRKTGQQTHSAPESSASHERPNQSQNRRYDEHRQTDHRADRLFAGRVALERKAKPSAGLGEGFYRHQKPMADTARAAAKAIQDVSTGCAHYEPVAVWSNIHQCRACCWKPRRVRRSESGDNGTFLGGVVRRRTEAKRGFRGYAATQIFGTI